MILKAAEKQGIVMKLGATVESIEGESSVTGVKLGTGEVLTADIVIVSSGVRANVAIAKDAGADINKAIVVNEKMDMLVVTVLNLTISIMHFGARQQKWVKLQVQMLLEKKQHIKQF